MDKIQSVRGWQYWVPRIATALVVPLLMLGIVEVALRAFGIGFPTSLTLPCTIQGRPASCDNLFFGSTFFPPGIIRLPRPYVIPNVKTKGTYRIFVLGESTAFGDPEPSYGFSRYLDVMLRQSYPDMNFEVINTGVTAINSHVVLPIAEGLADLQPDMFIVYVGNNEVVGPFGPGTVLTPTALALPVIRTNIFMKSTRVGELLAEALSSKGSRPPGGWGGMEMFLNKQVRADSPLMGGTYKNFAINLNDIVAVGRKAGARVVLSTIATNLKDCAPFASMHREGLTQQALQSWSALVQRGADLESAGSYAEAVKVYVAATEIDPQFAELQFRIARSLWRMGDFARAKEHYSYSQNLDTLRFRADGKINEAIRSVAATSGSSVELVDAAAIFDQASPHGISGDEYFYEHVHMTPEGNYLLARALFVQISSRLPFGARDLTAIGAAPSEEECERLLALTRYDRVRVAREMFDRLQKPPFTNQLSHDEQSLKLRLESDAPIDSYEETDAQYRWAIAQFPSDRLLHLNYGFLLSDRNPDAARQQFRIAQPYDDVPLARYGR